MCEWLSCASWCDVQLVCGGRAISAHRAVLASVSAFLRDLLLSISEDDCQTFIFLPEFDLEAMFSVLYYIYNGEVLLPQSRINAFLEIIQALKIFVDEKYLTKSTEFKTNVWPNYGKSSNDCTIKSMHFEATEEKACITIKQRNRTQATFNSLDFKDKRSNCCNQYLHTSQEGLRGRSDRQKKSVLRDSFIETYPRNGFANGLTDVVPAIQNAHYHHSKSFLLMHANCNDLKTRPICEIKEHMHPTFYNNSGDSKNYFKCADGDMKETIEIPKTKLVGFANNTTPPRKINEQQVPTQSFVPVDHRFVQHSMIEEETIVRNDESLKGINKDVRKKQVEIKLPVILNEVQKSPWMSLQPPSYIPFRRKNEQDDVVLSDLKNDKNNNETTKTEEYSDKNKTGNVTEDVTKSIFEQVPITDNLTSKSKSSVSTARYSCNECSKSFSQLRNYKYHMSVHRGTNEFAATCNECGKYFNDRGYLSSHMKIHRNRKEYKCPHCPKSFNQRVAYNMHVKIHSGIKPHICEQCGKAFSRKMLLKQHQRTHSGERPYACAHCGKRFADRSNMTLHLHLHTGIKPFSCTICSKSFTKKHHLKSHLNYHTGAKPYSCPRCKLAFTQSSNMRTHLKKCCAQPTNTTVKINVKC